VINVFFIGIGSFYGLELIHRRLIGTISPNNWVQSYPRSKMI
jgi:hypothetical protein